jgi:predicted transcriptional regulator
MAKSERKAEYGRVMSDGDLIKNDYTKHANVPDKVIVKDLDGRDMGMMRDYDDTFENLDKQIRDNRKVVMRNHPKSRY